MSRVYSKNRKELASIKLISSQDAFIIGRNGNEVLNPKINFFGKIYKNFLLNIILSANKLGKKNHYVDDTSSLPSATKERIVDFFINEKTDNGNLRRVVYLVRGDKGNKK